MVEELNLCIMEEEYKMGFCKDDIYAILNKKEYSIDEKIEQLKLFKQRADMEVDLEIEKLQKEIEYCPHCKKSYLKKFWDRIHKEEVRRVCTHWPIVAEDDAEYANKRCDVEYRVCPCGHMVETDRTVLD